MKVYQVSNCYQGLFQVFLIFLFQYDIFDAAQIYAKENNPLILIVGKEYGSGSSRDWAAKGPFLLVGILTKHNWACRCFISL